MNGEPSKHLNPLPAPVKQSAGGLSTKDLGKLWQKVSGVEPPNLQRELVRELADTLCFASYLDGKECDELIAAALLRLEQIQPQGPMEGMLGVQMIATYYAAMDCLRRAALPNVTKEERQAELRHAQKFFQTFALQLEAFDKHRRGNGRTVTHKHEITHSYDDVGKSQAPVDARGEGVEQVPQLTETAAVQIDPSAFQSPVGVPVPAAGQQ